MYLGSQHRFGLSYTIFLATIMFSANNFAAGFSLYNEGTGSAIGNFAAGIAAEYNDASTGWYNPAGLAFLHKPQAVIGAVGVMPYFNLNGNTLFITELPQLPDSPPFYYSQSFNNQKGADRAAVPSFHFAYPLGPNTTAALSVVSPYGLATDWDGKSALRYAATYTKLVTIDIAPELGGKLTDFLSVGLGLDLEKAYVTFNQVLGAPAILNEFGGGILPSALDSTSTNLGDSFGVGFHTGVLFHIWQDSTRLGINYQSAIQHRFYGDSTLKGPLADPNLNVFDPLMSDPKMVFANKILLSNGIALPSVTTLSLYQDLSARLALLGSVVYTSWSSIQNISLFNVAGLTVDNNGQAIQGNINAFNINNFRNTWRVALGSNLKINNKFLIRIGGGYDETPTISQERDIRLPDADRFALAIGGHYQFGSAFGVDFGYSHYFMNKIIINKLAVLDANNNFQTIATGNAHANLLGAQIVWTLD